MEMWLSRWLLLLATFVRANRDGNWPYCGNFAADQGYPLGCKTKGLDLCAEQSDECKTLVCKDDMKQEFRKCGAACNANPTAVSVPLEAYGLVCWCSRKEQKLCQSGNPFAAFLPQNNARKTPTGFERGRGGMDAFWGAAVEKEGETLMPVFCYDKKDSCPTSMVSFCERSTCPSGMCYFEGNCYYVAGYEGSEKTLDDPQLSACKPGKPAAIETPEENQFVQFLLTSDSIANTVRPFIATAGFVEAGGTEIVWKGWDFPVYEDIINLSVEAEDYDRLVYLVEGGDLLMVWGLAPVASPEVKFMLCKHASESEELCDSTTTTAESSGESNNSTSTSEPTTTPPTMTAPTTSTPTPTTSTPTEPSTSTTDEPTTTEETTETPTETEPTTTTEETTEGTTDDTTTEDPTTITPSCVNKCVKTDQYDEEWRCCEHSVCRRRCPLEANGSAVWSCGSSQYHTKWPDYDDCSNTWVDNITALVEEEKVSSFTLLVGLDQFVKDSSMFGHEISSVLNFTKVALDLLIKEQHDSEEAPFTKLHQRKFLTEMALGIVDKLLALAKPWEQLREREKMDVGTFIQSVSEKFGFSVAKKAFEIGNAYNMSCEWQRTHLESQYLRHVIGQANAVTMFPLTPHPKKSSIVIRQLPSRLLERYSNQVELTAVGTHLPMESAELMFPGAVNSFQNRKKKLNAGMVSMSLMGPRREPIHQFDTQGAVLVVFKHDRQAKGPAYSTIRHQLYPGEQPTAIQGTGRCVFWNESKGFNGQWDTSGCRMVNSSHWETVCECSHLSSFALLMDVHNYIAKDQVMEIVSIVFSTLSVISLAMTLFVLHGLKGIQGERNSIGKHLCLCLMTGHLMALTVLDRAYFRLSQEVCVGVAVVLHYVFLAAFMWMAVEGHHLYRLVVRVFDSGRDLSKIYLATGYGTPVVVVGITCAITGILGDSGYANDELCWLSSPDYIWAFMGPVLFLTLLNLVVLVLAMRVAVTAAGQQKKTFMERVKTWMRGWFSLSALLGVTWIFGFFYIQWDHNFAYAFITLNGCQGIFIFLTRVVFNEQVKMAMRRGAKQRAMMKRFYSLAWKGRSSGSSFHPSSWFFGTSSSSQLDLTSSASTSYWATTNSRRRSSANHSTHDDAPPPDNQNLYTNMSLAAGQQDAAKGGGVWHKRKPVKEDEIGDHLALGNNWNSGDIQQIWNNVREADTLSEIPEEDYDDDGYVQINERRIPSVKY